MTRHQLYLIRLGENDEPDISKEGFPYDEKYPYEGQDDEFDDFDEDDWEEAEAEEKQNQK